jgi:hypothetical protein
MLKSLIRTTKMQSCKCKFSIIFSKHIVLKLEYVSICIAKILSNVPRRTVFSEKYLKIDLFRADQEKFLTKIGSKKGSILIPGCYTSSCARN